jgi:hypothetical protein
MEAMDQIAQVEPFQREHFTYPLSCSWLNSHELVDYLEGVAE